MKKKKKVEEDRSYLESLYEFPTPITREQEQQQDNEQNPNPGDDTVQAPLASGAIAGPRMRNQRHKANEEEANTPLPRIRPDSVWKTLRELHWSYYRARALHNIGWHHLIMVVDAIGVIMLSLLVAGCSTSQLRRIWLVSLSYPRTIPLPSSALATMVSNSDLYDLLANMSSAADLRIRIGYFKSCIYSSTDENPDSLNLLVVADSYKDKVIVSIIIATVLLFSGLLFLSMFWQRPRDYFRKDRSISSESEFNNRAVYPSRRLVRLTLACHVLALLVLVVAVLWQHVAAVAHTAAAQAVFYAAVETGVGAAAAGLGWRGVLVTALATMMVFWTDENLGHQLALEDFEEEWSEL
ncbi:Ca2+ regulator and membrane fusion protein Fig1-domain-containing protein [Aspergillus karnatakaensis]|uniref:Ca2+ regulator and membrane fusion protein Fig1-domain-containing protein n=1 Tax=Aspergillus karnatakaensis TaxID=1810916 RepID=UPI003CCCFCA2